MIRNRHGFTLIEMVVVLLLISIIAAAVFTRTISTGQINFIGQVDKIRSQIRYVQSVAMKRSEVWVFNIDATDYWLSDISLNAERFPGEKTGKISQADLGVDMNAVSVYFDQFGKPYHSWVSETNNDPVTNAKPLTIIITPAGESSPKRELIITPETGLVITRK